MSEHDQRTGAWETDFEKELLRSASVDAPSPDARAKLLAALGVAGTAAALATARPAGMTAPATKGTAWVLKWTVIALLGTGSVAAGVVALRGQTPASHGAPPSRIEAAPASPLPPEPAKTTTAAEPARASPAGGENPPAPAPTPAPLPRAVHTATSVAAPTAAPIPPTTTVLGPSPPVTSGSSTAHAATDLTAETAAIDAARSALRQRRTADALALLDAYSRRFPQGTFEPEATALRIEALLPGDRAEGARLAREFLTAHPTGPLADRVRDLLNR